MRRYTPWTSGLLFAAALGGCGGDNPVNGTPGSPDARGDAFAIAPDTWHVALVAGIPGGSGAIDGVGTDARFGYIDGIAGSGSKLYLSDAPNGVIREFDRTSLVVRTIAGKLGAYASTAVDGAGEAASFRIPGSAAVLEGRLYVADNGTSEAARLRSVDLGTGEVKTVLDPATAAPWIGGNLGMKLAAGPDKLFIAADCAIWSYTPASGAFDVVAGKPGEEGSANGDAGAARFGWVGGLGYDPAGELIVDDSFHGSLRRVDLVNAKVEAVAGDPGTELGDYQPGFVDGTGRQARFGSIMDMAFAGTRAYFADAVFNPQVDTSGAPMWAPDFAKIRYYDTTSGAVGTLAGWAPPATAWVGEDVGAAEDARFLSVAAVWADADWIYVGSASALRRVSAKDGHVELLAGALIRSPIGRLGRLILRDGAIYAFSLRQIGLVRIDPASGETEEASGYRVGTFPVNDCYGVADLDGVLYCANSCADASCDYAVYAIDLEARTATVRATIPSPEDLVSDGKDLILLSGTTNPDGTAKYSLHRISGTSLHGNDATGEVTLLVDDFPVHTTTPRMAATGGALYVTDGTRLLRYDFASQKLDTFAGSDVERGCAAGTATEARFGNLLGIAAGPGGVFVGDRNCHTVSYVDAETGQVTTLAGSPEQGTFKEGTGTSAGVNRPASMVFDPVANVLYVFDPYENIIMRLSPSLRDAGIASDAGDSG